MKKITKTNMKKICQKVNKKSVNLGKINDIDIELQIKPTIEQFAKISSFVSGSSISNNAFDVTPQGYMFFYIIAETLTNLNFNGMDSDDIWNIYINTDLNEKIQKALSDEIWYNDLIKGISENTKYQVIQYASGANAEVNQLRDEVFDIFSNLIQYLEQVNEINQQYIKNIDAETLKKGLEIIQSGDVDKILAQEAKEVANG